MSRFTKKKRNNIITIVAVALAALALVTLISGIGIPLNEDNLLSLEFDDYKSNYGYEIIANKNGSLKFDGEFKSSAVDQEIVPYEDILLAPGTYTISTGCKGNSNTYCMSVTYIDADGETAVAYSDSGAVSTFTIDEKQEVTVCIIVNAGADIDGVVMYPTLGLGEEPIKFFSLI